MTRGKLSIKTPPSADKTRWLSVEEAWHLPLLTVVEHQVSGDFFLVISIGESGRGLVCLGAGGGGLYSPLSGRFCVVQSATLEITP